VNATPVGWRDHAFGFVLFASYTALLLNTADGLAMNRDESFYVVAAEQIAPWIERLFDDFGAAIDPEVIKRHWEYNAEHPALMKTLFAISWLAQQKWQLFEDDSAAFRFPGMLCSAAILWLVYIFGARAFDRRVGAIAAALFALMPHVFYHSHLDCFDVPIVFFMTLVTYCYWRSLENPWWAIWTGLAYGLALETKHNAWILPGILLIHFVWTVIGEARSRRAGRGRVVSFVPWWLAAQIVLGIPLFVALWPWLWSDGFERWRWYANFHVNHVHYHMAYFGTTYIRPPFPISFPFVMTAFTVPLTTLLLFALGVGDRLRAMVPPHLAARFWKNGAATPDRRFTEVLWFGCLLAPFVVIAMPSTPIFGGTKHWMTAYPFIALFAGIGFARVYDMLAPRVARLARRWNRQRIAVPAAGVLAGTLLVLPSAVETVHSHPFGLLHYTSLAGHVPGAADLGMNRQFWGYTHGELADWFAEQMPEGGTIWPCDATHVSWAMMHRDGMLPPNIRVASHMAHADYVLVHYEHHFAEVEGQAWIATGTVKPAHVLTYDGVPIVFVYENPRHARERENRARAQGIQSGPVR
jgi:4-amino-4-deoxy-L-arabinose transferase-like glycosyltransferase